MRFYINLFFLLIINSTIAQQFFYAKVIGIKDGDTVLILDEFQTQKTLRLAEVDCPEKKQAFGYKAKEFTSKEIYLKNIKYTITDTDRYGRYIAKIYYNNNKYISEEIIKNGFGWHYKKYSSSKKLAVLEKTAQKNKKGLWIDSNPIEPSYFRKIH